MKIVVAGRFDYVRLYDFENQIYKITEVNDDEKWNGSIEG